MEQSRERLAEQLVELMTKTHVMMKFRCSDEWSDVELTMTQMRVLVLLSQGPQRMGGIASYLDTSLSSATSLVERLVDKGLVERLSDPQDRRVVTCRLTEHGQQEMERFWQVGRMSILELTEQLTVEELESVIHAIEHLYRASLRVREGLPSQGSGIGCQVSGKSKNLLTDTRPLTPDPRPPKPHLTEGKP